jgi:hypothetical protein
MSVLKPEGSIMAAVAMGAFVYGTYQAFLPSVADARSAQPGNQDLQAAERSASFITAGVVAGVSIIAKDPTIFIVGGAMVIGMAWFHRHADAVIPELGLAVPKIGHAGAHAEPAEDMESPNNDYTYEASA